LALIAFPANVGAGSGVQTSLLAPLRVPGGAYAGQLPALDAHGSVRYPLEMIPKGMSDQSIFTGGGSNRSSQSRSRRTNHSSFSTETDGLSAKTDSVDSLKHSPSIRGLPAHLEAALEACQEENELGSPTYLPYRPTEVQTMQPMQSNIAVNLFPEGSAHNSQDSSASREAPPEPRTQPPLSAEAQRARLLFEKRALIVDDSATNRKFVNRLLRTKIGTRDEAEDGQVAVRMVAQAMAENAPYDVILMDYVMPVMDGPTATEEIRRLGFKGVILGVTGNGHQPEIDLFVKAGADKVLIKPLSADQFYGTLLGKITHTHTCDFRWRLQSMC
jgi:CheY-like chemotaxis protein